MSRADLATLVATATSSRAGSGPPGWDAAVDCLRARRIRLLLAGGCLAPEAVDAAGLARALEVTARAVRLPALADDLNPLVLDPGRVAAFLFGLPRQPAAVLDRLADGFLVLGAEGLWLSAASPVEAATLAEGFVLEVPAGGDRVIQPRARVRVRPAFAAGVASRAQAALAICEAEVERLEHARAELSVLTSARWRRFGVATTWRIAATALATVDRDAGRLAERATAAARRYVTPPWNGLPPRPGAEP